MRKFLERCGFIMESVMRKHRVVDNRNRDTAVYVTLNSDWDQINIKLKKILGLGLGKKMHKVAEIEGSSPAVKEITVLGANSSSESEGKAGALKATSQHTLSKKKK